MEPLSYHSGNLERLSAVDSRYLIALPPHLIALFPPFVGPLRALWLSLPRGFVRHSQSEHGSFSSDSWLDGRLVTVRQGANTCLRGRNPKKTSGTKSDKHGLR